MTLHINGLALVDEPSNIWPKVVVSLVFDDGWLSQYTEARKAMDPYWFAATAYIIQSLIDNNASYMTMAQLTNLRRYSGWEIAAHAYTDADHAANFANLTATQLAQDFLQLQAWPMSNGFRGMRHLAYPGGRIQPRGDRRRATALCVGSHRLWQQHRDMATGRSVSAADISHVLNTTTLSAIETSIDNAYANKQWLILTFHKLVSTPSLATEWAITDFTSLMSYIQQQGHSGAHHRECLG